jgi:hypothetical protein
MKSKSSIQQRNYKSAIPPHSSMASHLNQNETEVAPAAEAVAKRAYFIYLNQGSLPGHDLHYWLEAEAQLRAGRNRPLIRGFAARNRSTLEPPGNQGGGRVRQNGSGKARPDYEQQLH